MHQEKSLGENWLYQSLLPFLNFLLPTPKPTKHFLSFCCRWSRCTLSLSELLLPATSWPEFGKRLRADGTARQFLAKVETALCGSTWCRSEWTLIPKEDQFNKFWIWRLRNKVANIVDLHIDTCCSIDSGKLIPNLNTTTPWCASLRRYLRYNTPTLSHSADKTMKLRR